MEMWHLDCRLKYKTHAFSLQKVSRKQAFTAFLSLDFLLGISFGHGFTQDVMA